VLAAAPRSLHEAVWWWHVGRRVPWLMWTVRGLAFVGYVGLFAAVTAMAVSPESRRSDEPAPGQETNVLDWTFWVFLGLLAIPAFAFGAVVITVLAPILAVLWLVIGAMLLVDLVRSPPT
jgi:hypothetical protein